MNDSERRELVERSAQIQELTRHPGWELLQDFCREKLAMEQEWLLLGRAKNMEEYQRKVGFSEGVIHVFKAPGDLLARVERAHEDK